MQSTAKTFFILAQKKSQIFSLISYENGADMSVLSAFPFSFYFWNFYLTSSSAEGQRPHFIILPQLVLLKWAGKNNCIDLSVTERLGAYTPSDTRTSQGRGTHNGGFHYFCSWQNLVFDLFTRHIASMVNIIQELETKLDRKFYLASQWLTDLEGEERIS